MAQIISKLYELQIIKKGKNGSLPHRRSYEEACEKLPSEVVQDLMRKSHKVEYDSIGKTFKGLKVIIPDGTINSMSINEETEAKYGAGCGHYAQAQAVGFYELSTCTFDDYRLEPLKK